MLFFHYFGRFGVTHIMWGHDSHLIFIEHVLYISMELGINLRDLIRFSGIDIQFIGNTEIVQSQSATQRVLCVAAGLRFVLPP